MPPRVPLPLCPGLQEARGGRSALPASCRGRRCLKSTSPVRSCCSNEEGSKAAACRLGRATPADREPARVSAHRCREAACRPQGAAAGAAGTDPARWKEEPSAPSSPLLPSHSLRSIGRHEAVGEGARGWQQTAGCSAAAFCTTPSFPPRLGAASPAPAPSPGTHPARHSAAPCGVPGLGAAGSPTREQGHLGPNPSDFFKFFLFFFFLDLDLCRVNICDLCNRHFLPGGQDAAPDKYYFFCLTGCFVSLLPNAHCRGRHPCFANAQAALVPFWSCICYSPPLLFRWSPCLQPGVSSVCAKSVQCWLCEVNYCRTPRTFSAGVANLQSTENKGGARRLHPHCACLQKDARASADKPLAVSGHF